MQAVLHAVSTHPVAAAVIVGAVAVTALCGVSRRRRRAADTPEGRAASRLAAAREPWAAHVVDHDGAGLVELYPDTLWHVVAKHKGYGPPWRRMVVYKPPGSRDLLLFSAIALDAATMTQLESLGRPAVLVVPNHGHRADAAVFKARYPDIRVASPGGWVRDAVSAVVEVDLDVGALRYGDAVRVCDIDGLAKPGTAPFEHAYELRCGDRWAFLVTDTLFNARDSGFIGWVFGSRGLPSGGPGMARLSRWFAHDLARVGAWYRKLSRRTDVCCILMAHGDAVTDDCAAAFAAIAADLGNREP